MTVARLHEYAARLAGQRRIVLRKRRLALGGLRLDLGAQQADAEVMEALLAWARSRGLRQRFRELCAGHPVNNGKAALHTALRGTPAMQARGTARRMALQLNRALAFADRIRQGRATGPGGRPCTDIVNLGVGGSELGQRLLVEALGSTRGAPTVHFVAGPDGLELERLLARLDPQRVLFIVGSKSFGTWETLLNARRARDWLQARQGPAAIRSQMVGISAARGAMREFGLSPSRCFSMEATVGGRYSVWSAMGLAAMICVGTRAFQGFLDGGRDMDRRVLQTPAARNPAVLLALFDAWNISYLGVHSRVLLVFDERLAALVPYLGQLEMESLGKPVGQGVPLWGGPGYAARHSYFQLLYQGSSPFAADLVLVQRAPAQQLQPRRAELLHRAADCARVLARGRGSGSGRCPGGRPHSILHLQALTPRTLGQLIALYEHKVYALSVLWGSNAFDQPFVDAVRR